VFAAASVAAALTLQRRAERMLMETHIQGASAPQPLGDPEVIKTLGIGKGATARRWILRGLVAVLLVAVAFAFALRFVRSRAESAAPKFKTAAAARGDIHVTITATGTLKGLNTVEVGAEVSGKVLKVNADFNDRVKKGQVLAEIDPEQQRAAVDESSARVSEADAAIRQAKATLVEARQSAARAELQVREGVASQKELETAKAAEARAEAALASASAGAIVARASLKSARSRLEKTTILSPIDGVVLARLIEPGQTVTAGFQTPVLFKLAEDLRRMSLHVFVDEADVGRAREGQGASFTVDAYPERVFPSKVTSLRNEPKTEQNVVTYEAVLAVDNADLLLRPGMTATATIIAEVREGVLTVPNAALRFTPPSERPRQGFGPPQPTGPSAAGPRVWVQRGAAPEAISVKIGASDGRVTEILSGDLTEGTEVLVDVAEPG
jgi:HlyD family secretion protein